MPPPASITAPAPTQQPSWFSVALGLAPSAPSWPANIQQGIAIAQHENPDLAPVQPYGALSRALMSQAQGYTSPARTIYLNPAQLEGFSPQDIADTIVHEQTHVRQMRERGHGAIGELLREAMGSSLPYGQRPDEMVAFAAEQQRRAQMGRMQTARPSFGGGFMVPADINLPRPR